MGLLIEGKLNLSTTVDGQVLISNVSTLGIYNRWLSLFIPREPTYTYLRLPLPMVRAWGRALRVLELRLCPLQRLLPIVGQVIDQRLIDNSRQ